MSDEEERFPRGRTRQHLATIQKGLEADVAEIERWLAGRFSHGSAMETAGIGYIKPIQHIPTAKLAAFALGELRIQIAELQRKRAA